MKLIFPQNPSMRKLPEPVFEPEFDAAKSLGFDCLLLNEDAIIEGDIEAALSRLPPGGGQLLYRGWILTEEQYRAFEQALNERGYSLVTPAAQYAEVTYFPLYYAKIRDHSPAAVWTDVPDTYAAWSASRKLGDGPFVLKDHIKSAKHRWHDACFVPRGASREQFEFIAGNLKEQQGSSFFRGFVIKEYVPLEVAGLGPREYPECEEYRLFFWQRRLLSLSHYHRRPEKPFDLEPFLQVAQRFDAPFFSMDIARSQQGRWLIVDMGAGECSSLPPNVQPLEFYQRLKDFMAVDP